MHTLVAEAELHAVLPALVRNFPDFARGPSYAAARDDALSRRRQAFGQAVMLRSHAAQLMQACHGLPVAVVKGPAFARSIYPDPALRSFTDVDLLVAPDSEPTISAILGTCGFVRAEHEEAAGRLEVKWVLASNPMIQVEVHTNMVHHPGLRQAVSLTFADIADGLDSPPANLAIATIHGALHQYERLQQVVDVCQAARAIETPDQERQLERLVARTGARLAATVGLELAHRLLQEPRCLELARGLGPERYLRTSRMLLGPSVVHTTKTRERVMHSWRRKTFRAFLKRTGGRLGD